MYNVQVKQYFPWMQIVRYKALFSRIKIACAEGRSASPIYEATPFPSFNGDAVPVGHRIRRELPMAVLTVAGCTLIYSHWSNATQRIDQIYSILPTRIPISLKPLINC